MESDTSVPEANREAARFAKPLDLEEATTEMPATKVVEASKVPTATWLFPTQMLSMIAPKMKADLDAYGTANMKISWPKKHEKSNMIAGCSFRC